MKTMTTQQIAAEIVNLLESMGFEHSAPAPFPRANGMWTIKVIGVDYVIDFSGVDCRYVSPGATLIGKKVVHCETIEALRAALALVQG